MEKVVVTKKNICNSKARHQTKVLRPPFHTVGELLRCKYADLNDDIWPRDNYINLLNDLPDLDSDLYWMIEEENLWHHTYMIDWLADHKIENFDTRFIINNFPGAKAQIKDLLNREIELCEKDIVEAERIAPILSDIIYRKVPEADKDFWNDLVQKLFIEPLTKRQVVIIKKNCFFLSALKGNSSTQNPIGVTPDEIAKAKDYPITTLIDFKHNTACCFNHSEKTPSLHYYPQSNTCHCFGACQKSFDSIEVYRLLNNCSFVEAVRKLQ